MDGSAGKSVLIVDDDADIRAALSEVLRDEGFDTATAVDGEDALAWLRKNGRPCVIVLDMMMPVMNGAAFLDAVAALPDVARVPVVVMSAGRGPFAGEFDAVLRKPFALDDVVRAVAARCAPQPA